MSNNLQNWAEKLSINPATSGRDQEWEKIAKRIKTKQKKKATFWDSNILVTSVVLLAAIFAGVIIIRHLSEIKQFLGV
jgi:nitric oxide synthase oxygenase domain/subunit